MGGEQRRLHHQWTLRGEVIEAGRDERDDFFSTGMMVVTLKHEGTTAWLRQPLAASEGGGVVCPWKELRVVENQSSCSSLNEL